MFVETLQMMLIHTSMFPFIVVMLNHLSSIRVNNAGYTLSWGYSIRITMAGIRWINSSRYGMDANLITARIELFYFDRRSKKTPN
jgi:hypothetical protein